MAYVKPIIPTNELRKEMDKAFEESAQMPNYSGLRDDLEFLDATSRNDGFVKAHGLAISLIKKWKQRLGIKMMPSSLYEQIGFLAQDNRYYKIASHFFEEAHNVNSQNYSLYVARTLEFVRAHKFDKALKSAKKAYELKANVHTASKYAELLWLHHAPKDEISLVVSPFIEESLNRRNVRFSHSMILALNLVLRTEGEKPVLENSYSKNNFYKPNETLSFINRLARILFLNNRNEMIQRETVRTAPGRDQQNIDMGAVDRFFIETAYSSSRDLWNGVYPNQPIDNVAKRVAGFGAGEATRHFRRD